MNLPIDWNGRGALIIEKRNLSTRKDGRITIFLEPEELRELTKKLYSYVQTKKAGVY